MRIEQAINRALFSEKEKGVFYVRFNMDGLMRGDYKSRITLTASGTMITNPGSVSSEPVMDEQPRRCMDGRGKRDG